MVRGSLVHVLTWLQMIGVTGGHGHCSIWLFDCCKEDRELDLKVYRPGVMKGGLVESFAKVVLENRGTA
jgi:hypothetical protein